MGVAVVTGANRGIGFEFVRQLKLRGARVVAVCRTSSPGLDALLITSRMGSIGDNASGGHYGYRMSKAALNAAGVSLAHDLKPRGIAVVMLHPGAVRTGMTGGRGAIEADESVRGLLQRIDELRLDGTGRFLHQNGDVLPW